MHATAFSIPSNRASGLPSKRKTRHPLSESGRAADLALRATLGHRTPQPPKQTVLGAVAGGAADVVRGSMAELGLPQWTFRAVVFGGVALVLGVAVKNVSFAERPPCPVFPATGTVVVGQVVPAGAQVVLHPKGAELPDNVLPMATVRGDGSFVLTTFRAGDGAPEGEYVATVQWFPVSEEGAAGRNALPERYSSVDQSPLVVSIRPGVNRLPPFEVTTTLRR